MKRPVHLEEGVLPVLGRGGEEGAEIILDQKHWTESEGLLPLQGSRENLRARKDKTARGVRKWEAVPLSLMDGWCAQPATASSLPLALG